MKALVYIWEEYVTELKKAKRNAKIYETMAKQLYELTGEQRHREEIKMKITNMTFQYRQSAPPSGFLPEYTGSSEDKDNDDEEGLTEDSGSSFETRSQPRKRRRLSHASLRRKKLHILDAMLHEHRKIGRTVEEACHEVRRVMHQQNFLQVQSLQLQERMMNLLEKMIPAVTHPVLSWPKPPATKGLGTPTPES
ncbi:Myb/SANT-like DNA-binding domain-containing protein 1 [Triplophysa tibetana]|uniref:Myb/SANT-like DNA-binding domain-containing protein 1 n=1 Tax=Triplophysa tibetana TaxID=1572043 RepID=A0A5A9PKY4_9TELE|nr:Myb/SANT-like DNA-binding domain-containing protein 1 [Triplophysa tibetana]